MRRIQQNSCNNEIFNTVTSVNTWKLKIFFSFNICKCYLIINALTSVMKKWQIITYFCPYLLFFVTQSHFHCSQWFTMMIINTLTRVMNIILHSFLKYQKYSKMWIQFKNKHLIVRMIQQNSCNNKINSSGSNKNSSLTYLLINSLVTVPEINKVTRYSQFTMVSLPPTMLQNNHINITVF